VKRDERCTVGGEVESRGTKEGRKKEGKKDMEEIS
jgi:hypothetical protein